MPCLLLTILTIVFRMTDVDRAIVRLFYADVPPGGTFQDHWPLANSFPWSALYYWGVVPGWILGCGGLIVWITSFWRPALERFRDPGLFYFLVLLLGPGILVNVVLKPYCGRPRPNALIEFGGQRDFLPVGQWRLGQDEASFPSGHASMGFYLMVPAFVYYRRRPRLALGFLLFGIFAGLTIGLARIVAGGHFPSDIIWSGGVVYFAALLIALPFHFGRSVPAATIGPQPTVA